MMNEWMTGTSCGGCCFVDTLGALGDRALPFCPFLSVYNMERAFLHI
jgi:hypothetical protein